MLYEQMVKIRIELAELQKRATEEHEYAALKGIQNAVRILLEAESSTVSAQIEMTNAFLAQKTGQSF